VRVLAVAELPCPFFHSFYSIRTSPPPTLITPITIGSSSAPNLFFFQHPPIMATPASVGSTAAEASPGRSKWGTKLTTEMREKLVASREELGTDSVAKGGGGATWPFFCVGGEGIHTSCSDGKFHGITQPSAATAGEMADRETINKMVDSIGTEKRVLIFFFFPYDTDCMIRCRHCMEKANIARALTSYDKRQRGQYVARKGLRTGRHLSQTG